MLQRVAAGQATVSVTTAMSAGQGGRSIVVNTAGTAGLTQPFQHINKRVGQAGASQAAASNAQLIGTPITVSFTQDSESLDIFSIDIGVTFILILNLIKDFLLFSF